MFKTIHTALAVKDRPSIKSFGDLLGRSLILKQFFTIFYTQTGELVRKQHNLTCQNNWHLYLRK